MKITITSSELKSIISKALKLGTGDVTHPGFSLAHVEVTAKGGLRITVVNARAAARIVCNQKTENPFVAGGIALSLKNMNTLSSVIGQGDELVTIDATPGKVLRVSIDGQLIKVPLDIIDNVVSFPSRPENVEWFDCDTSVFDIANKVVSKFCATENSGRANLAGIHFTSEFCEATNGHSLIRYNVDEGFVNKEAVILPSALPGTITTMTGSRDGAEKVKVALNSNRIWVQGKDFIITCATIPESYPDTSSLIIDESSREVTSSKGIMLECSRLKVSLADLKNATSNIVKVSGGSNSSQNFGTCFKLNLAADKDGTERLFAIAKYENADGINIACRLSFEWLEDTDKGEEKIASLNKVLLNPILINDIVSSLPMTTEDNSDMITLTFVSEFDRMILRHGNIIAMLMPMSPER